MNLRHIVEFWQNNKKSSLEQDDWVLICKAFAHISVLKPTQMGMIENSDFGHIITASFFLITVRKITQINSQMRVKFKDRNFEIKKIIEDFENDKFLKIIILEIK